MDIQHKDKHSIDDLINNIFKEDGAELEVENIIKHLTNMKEKDNTSKEQVEKIIKTLTQHFPKHLKLNSEDIITKVHNNKHVSNSLPEKWQWKEPKESIENIRNSYLHQVKRDSPLPSQPNSPSFRGLRSRATSMNLSLNLNEEFNYSTTLRKQLSFNDKNNNLDWEFDDVLYNNKNFDDLLKEYKKLKERHQSLIKQSKIEKQSLELGIKELKEQLNEQHNSQQIIIEKERKLFKENQKLKKQHEQLDITLLSLKQEMDDALHDKLMLSKELIKLRKVLKDEQQEKRVVKERLTRSLKQISTYKTKNQNLLYNYQSLKKDLNNNKQQNNLINQYDDISVKSNLSEISLESNNFKGLFYNDLNNILDSPQSFHSNNESFYSPPITKFNLGNLIYQNDIKNNSYKIVSTKSDSQIHNKLKDKDIINDIKSKSFDNDELDKYINQSFINNKELIQCNQHDSIDLLSKHSFINEFTSPFEINLSDKNETLSPSLNIKLNEEEDKQINLTNNNLKTLKRTKSIKPQQPKSLLSQQLQLNPYIIHNNLEHNDIINEKVNNLNQLKLSPLNLNMSQVDIKDLDKQSDFNNEEEITTLKCNNNKDSQINDSKDMNMNYNIKNSILKEKINNKFQSELNKDEKRNLTLIQGTTSEKMHSLKLINKECGDNNFQQHKFNSSNNTCKLNYSEKDNNFELKENLNQYFIESSNSSIISNIEYTDLDENEITLEENNQFNNNNNNNNDNNNTNINNSIGNKFDFNLNNNRNGKEVDLNYKKLSEILNGKQSKFNTFMRNNNNKVQYSNSLELYNENDNNENDNNNDKIINSKQVDTIYKVKNTQTYYNDKCVNCELNPNLNMNQDLKSKSLNNIYYLKEYPELKSPPTFKVYKKDIDIQPYISPTNNKKLIKNLMIYKPEFRNTVGLNTPLSNSFVESASSESFMDDYDFINTSSSNSYSIDQSATPRASHLNPTTINNNFSFEIVDEFEIELRQLELYKNINNDNSVASHSNKFRAYRFGVN